MPAWVDSPTWGAKVADCGPYIGEWPPYPPLPAAFALEPDSSEIDYLIAAPNPSGDPGAVADDTYDTIWLDIWRDGVDGGAWSSDLGTSGAAAPDWTDPPPGAHMFVLWYDGTGTTPAHDALELAPANMVSGGTAAAGEFASGGVWSDWIDDDSVVDISAGPTDSYYLNRANDGAYTGSGTSGLLPDPVGVTRAYLLAGLAGHNVDVDTFQNLDNLNRPLAENWPFVGVDMHARLDTSMVGGLHSATVISTQTTIQVGVFALPGGAFDQQPADLIPGIDFVLTVDMLENGAWWQRDPDDTQTVQWAYWNPTLLIRSSSDQEIPHSPVAIDNLVDGGGTVRLAAIPDTLPATLADYTAGDTLWTQSGLGLGTTHPELSGPGLRDTGDIVTPMIDLAGHASDAVLRLVFYPSVIVDGTDIVMPEPESDLPPEDSYGANSESGVDVTVVTWHQETTAGNRVWATSTMKRWRYLLPGGVKWHTCGGHWATAGGLTLEILTPGVGWVPFVDGPA